MVSDDQPITDRRIHACLWLVLTLAATGRTLVVNGASGLVLVLFWAVVNAAGLTYAAGQRDAAVTAQARRISESLAVLGMLAFLLQLLSGGGIVQALLTLVLAALSAKNPVLQQRRDAHFALLGSLAVVSWAAGKSFDGGFVLLLVAYALAGLMTLALLHQQKAHERATAVLSGATHVRGYSWRHLAVISVAVLVCAAFWYLLVPRPAAIHYGTVADTGGNDYRDRQWQDEAESGAGSRSAVPHQGDGPAGISPAPAPGTGQGSDRESVPREVMLNDVRRAAARHANPLLMVVDSERPLYLRQKVFDVFENDRWRSSQDRLEKRLLDQGGRFLMRQTNPAPDRFRAVKYSVQVVRTLDSGAVPFSADLEELHFPGPVLALAADETVVAPRQLGAGTQYSAVSFLPAGSGRPVIESGRSPEGRYLQLPDSFTTEMRELAAKAAGGAGNDSRRALAIEHYLRTHYSYSEESIFTSQGVTPMQDFLFRTRSGHCEYFASAMALFLRAQGIPSRVVHGYSVASYNPLTGYYEVHRFDGHAWVEGFIAGEGWVTFEATPAYTLPSGEGQKNVALEDLDAYVRRMVAQENQLGLHDWKQVAAAVVGSVTSAWYRLGRLADELLDAATNWLRVHVWLFTGLVLALGMVVLLWSRLRAALWFALGALALAVLPARTAAPVRAIAFLSRIGAHDGLARRDDETMDAYLDRLRRLRPGLDEHAARLLALANRSCYAPVMESRLSAHEKKTVRADFRRLGGALLEALQSPRS